ncbi:hypothetical protein BQ9231_00283 [Cedratvirus lausannensis]|uniref:F-box domain-containing protein n=2 Tax=Pithoviruses TaxID=2023203 RepID=A0A285PYA9_9VIRU|nr:hypothetical protein BQ9231_00283 [Cedratvirus lausannensis]
MWEHILSFSLLSDFASQSLVCRLFRCMLSQDNYWLRKEKKTFAQIKEEHSRDRPARLLIKNLKSDTDLFTISCLSMNRRKIFLDLRKFLYRYFAREDYHGILQRVEDILHTCTAKEFTLSVQAKHTNDKTYFRLFLAYRARSGHRGQENTILERRLQDKKQLLNFFRSCREIKKAGIKKMTCSSSALDLFLN